MSQPTAPSVVLTGTYNSMNKGDAAMELSTLADLQERFPSARCTVISPFTAIDEPFYAPTPVVHSSRRDAIGVARTVLWVLGMLVTRRSRFVANSPLATAEIRAIGDADIAIDLSGDMLTEDSGFLVGFSHFLPLAVAHAAGTPFVVLAQSIGPFRRLRPIARWALRRAAAVTIREEETRDHLDALGSIDHQLTADMAFLLRPDATAIERNGVSPGAIGVSVSELVSRHVADHQRDLVDELATSLRRAAEASDREIVVVAHVTGPSDPKDDRIIGRRLAAAVGDRARLLDADLRPEELKGIIGSCSLFIGARMHANIAALGSGVPVIALSYSHKTSGIMEAFGQADAVVAPSEVTADHLDRTIDHVGASESDRRRQILDALQRTQAAARTNIEVVATVLSGEQLPCDRQSAR